MDYGNLDSLSKEGSSEIQAKLNRLQGAERSKEELGRRPCASKYKAVSKGVRRGIRRLKAARTRAEYREQTIAAKVAMGGSTYERRQRLKKEREHTRHDEVVDVVNCDDSLPTLDVVIHQPHPRATINYIIKVRESDEGNPRFKYIKYRVANRFFKKSEVASDVCKEILEEESKRKQRDAQSNSSWHMKW